MTIDEKLELLDSALLKFTEIRQGKADVEFTIDECRTIMGAIDIAASVCEFFKERDSNGST